MRALRLIVGLGLLLAACTGPAAPRTDGARQPGRVTLGDDEVTLAAALQPFDACDDLLAYFRRHALDQVGPYGLPGLGGDAIVVNDTVTAEAGGESRASSAPVAGVDYSGTNVQELGVDEPDIVKTDGRVVVAVARQKLQVVDLDRPGAVAGTLALEGWDHELLLDGDRLLVLATAEGGPHPARRLATADSTYGGAAPISVLTLVDLSDPARPRVEAELTLDGAYRSARMTDGTARVVLASLPAGLDFTHPKGGGLRAERHALERNRAVIRESTVADWLPYYVLEDRRGGGKTTTEGTLLDCAAVSRPPEFSGLGLLSVLTINLGGSLTTAGDVAIVASGETVYASPRTLYVATNRWFDPVWPAQGRRIRPVEDYTTELHAFDITDPSTARYVASGRVRGHLLNQFSMSEHDGRLRVATTDGVPWAEPAGRSQSYVTVLEPRGGRLERRGRVGGLGRGERIYSVRFLGDVGYVVTFRETDPLYTIDLADPDAPRVTGELKIRGYSAYLHPVDEDLLLGVGQDATGGGRTLGTQLSLFDVSDPAAPVRVARARLAGGHSEAEYDHRAFLYWPARRLAVVPVESWDVDKVSGAEHFTTGVHAFTIDRGAIRESGRVTHARGPHDWHAQIRRSLVAGDALVTVSERGLLVSDLATLAPGSFARFR